MKSITPSSFPNTGNTPFAFPTTQPNEEIISSPQPVSAVQLVLENGNKITLDDPQSSVLALNNNAANMSRF
jgi:hypothetical protein